VPKGKPRKAEKKNVGTETLLHNETVGKPTAKKKKGGGGRIVEEGQMPAKKRKKRRIVVGALWLRQKVFRKVTGAPGMKENRYVGALNDQKGGHGRRRWLPETKVEADTGGEGKKRGEGGRKTSLSWVSRK